MTVSGVSSTPYSYYNVLNPVKAPATAVVENKPDVPQVAPEVAKTKTPKLSDAVLALLQELDPANSVAQVDLFGTKKTSKPDPLKELLGNVSDKGSSAELYVNVLKTAYNYAPKNVAVSTIDDIINSYQATQNNIHASTDAEFKAFLDSNTKGLDGKLLKY